MIFRYSPLVNLFRVEPTRVETTTEAIYCLACSENGGRGDIPLSVGTRAVVIGTHTTAGPPQRVTALLSCYVYVLVGG